MPAELLQRQRELADAHVHARLFAVVRPGAAGPRAAQHSDPARRHVQPFQDRRAARAARLGPVQRHRGRRSRHSPDAEGLSRRRRRLDHLRGGELPRRQLDPAALALDQGLHADLPGPHPAAAASASAPPACSASSASCSSSAARCSSGLLNPIFWLLYLVWLVAVAHGFDPLFPQLLLFLSLFNLLAGNGAFIFLQHAGADPPRLARPHPLQPHRRSATGC